MNQNNRFVPLVDVRPDAVLMGPTGLRGERGPKGDPGPASADF